MPHLTADLYRMVLDGQLPPRAFVRALYLHLLETCPHCEDEWESARPFAPKEEHRADREAAEERAPRLAQAAAFPSEAVAFTPDGRRLHDEARRLRITRRQATEDLRELLATRPERREERIVNARQRYRSRTFVEMLFEHARGEKSSAPREAAALLDLIPVALLWTQGGHDSAWARVLGVRAQAHRADALRVAGELEAAESVWADLRRRLTLAPLAVPAVYAEMASLKSGLRIAQGELDEAAALLDQAVLVYQEAGEVEGLARALIRRGSLSERCRKPGDAAADLERARALLDPEEQTDLYLSTVVALVPLLVDADRHGEAERVLAESEDAFETAEEPKWALRLRRLHGLAALGRGELDRAEELLTDAREGFVEEELPYEFAVVSLDLALVHLRHGRTAELRRLTREIGVTLRSAGVARETLATLALLHRASAADGETLARVARLRRELARVATDSERSARQDAPQ